MKRYVTAFSFLFSFHNHSPGQNISLERAIQPDYYTYQNALVYDSTDGSYVLGGQCMNVSSGFSSPPYLAKVDSLGNEPWFAIPFIGAAEVASVYNVVQATGGGYIFSGFQMPVCDVFGDYGFVQKISSTGNTEWSKLFHPGSFSFTAYERFGVGLSYLQNNTIMVSADTLVYSLNPLGDSLNYFNLFKGTVREIQNTPDSFVLFGCDSGLVKTDLSGTILNATNSLPVKNIVVSTPDSYIYTIGKTVFRCDSLLSTINQNNLQNVFSEIRKIRADQNTYWVLGKQVSTGMPLMLILDDTLGIINTHVYNGFNGSDFDPNNFILHTNNYSLIGYENTEATRHTFIKSFSKTGHTSFNFEQDAGIISMRADSSYANLIPGPNFHYVAVDVYATVKNFGSDTLNNVFWNLFSQETVICIPNAFSESLFNLALAPGDSFEFHIGWVGKYIAGFSPPDNYDTICAWTSSPNSKMDVNHSNDQFCGVFLVTNFTGVEEQNIFNEVSVTPNPIEDYLNVDFKSKRNVSAFLEVYSIAGVKLKSVIILPGKNKIDLRELESGFYMVSLKDDKNTCSKKIIKY